MEFPYLFHSKVIKGEGMGRTIGFPTLNLQIPLEFSLKEGVYYAIVKIGSENFKAGMHYGHKKTLSPNLKSLELHLVGVDMDFSFSGVLEVSVRKFLRPIKQFSKKQALITQIAKDVALIQSSIY